MTTPTTQCPQPPLWATRTVAEDGGLTHEHVSTVHPQRFGWVQDAPAPVRPTDLSLSVVDRPCPQGWVRAEPTVQVEGGTFTVAEARRLRAALDDLLANLGTV